MPFLKDIMTPDVEVIVPDATAEEASIRMRDRNIGAIPVCNAQKLIGMVTDRDLVIRVMAEGQHPKGVRVADAMTRELYYCFEDDEIQKAAALMAEKQIRRLPVISRSKRLVGIVSLGDLAARSTEPHTGGHVLKKVADSRSPGSGS